MSFAAQVAIPPALAEIAARVIERIAACLDANAERWAALDAELAAPLASLRALVMAGGKRLRPSFCYWAFVGLGGSGEDPSVIHAGAALELLHTFALVHDDVMDGSPMRHGIEAVHVEHHRRHSRAAWRENRGRFGDGVAILVGDLAFVYCDRFLTSAAPAARRVFDEMRLEVNVGQYLDLIGTARRSGDPGLARRICQYKSGKYTIERPLHLGAALAAPTASRRWPGGCRPTGCPSGKPSGCATTCSECSVTPLSPASPSEMTCERASRRCSTPSPGRLRSEPTGGSWSAASAPQTWGRPR